MKGDLAVTTAIATLTRLGMIVSVPITESAQYDLIVEDGSGLHRVQVKYSQNGKVGLRRIHSNSQGYVVKHYDLGGYDWLFVHVPDRGDFLYKSQPANLTQLTVSDDWKVN